MGTLLRLERGQADVVLAVVPEDETITRAEREGRAPIDVDPGAPAVRALHGLAGRLADYSSDSSASSQQRM